MGCRWGPVHAVLFCVLAATQLASSAGVAPQAPSAAAAQTSSPAAGHQRMLALLQGSVGDAHMAGYLDEFVFRFNRRRSRSRGMVFYRVLDLAVAHAPVRYKDLIASARPAGPAASAAARSRTPAEPGAPSSEPPMENKGPGLLRLNGYPRLAYFAEVEHGFH